MKRSESSLLDAANGWGSNAAAMDAGLYWLAGAALTLVHESIHQYGVSDEAVTECTALKVEATIEVFKQDPRPAA